MRLLTRTKRTRLQDRAVWQAASLLLAYPDEQHSRRLDTVAGLLEHLDGKPAELLGRTLTALRKTDPLTAATAYVDTFDMRRRATMYLTYWTAGDTRNRGMAMLAFSSAYRRAGVEPPRNEGPDYLPVVLEFAATVDAESGRRLLVANRVPIDVLATALAAADSPYAHTIAAVAETLPAVSDQQVKRARELVETGPPTESVGLQPYSLTGPPREEG
ncbi:nitrate reductase molybdenum cofactor assembly chaperone [Mycobacterium koreense]|uniref:Nitrate reductase molybdenum cofactor assembly chaperone n=1 Tax=Mycolicibacillus koreensis TaxID=1069220 RepID=A0AA91PCE6_9MYCO|nr:nitrate reductase molybdenum cofactor assembly chaperone [Mycolicibacillus koreensis]MCV7250018.1 nitrate reductase molybdenum cofactor assembly chaperone [Mycolicibacillus koreensis]ODR04931.1 nitrate reductase molybdenum cofactor assembly chaperone [Mycolicibacillus koreensis]OSC31787.1 nitrate reductase molybdenum cofactor assembly chaperone [Mycolicibacillus koreensis]